MLLGVADLATDGERLTIGPPARVFLQPRHGHGPIRHWPDARGPGSYAALEPRFTRGARLRAG